MKKTKIDHNSTENQRIKGMLVDHEVKACFSYEMESILRASAEGQSDKNYPLPTFEDIENLYHFLCPVCGESHADEDKAKQCCATNEQIENGDIDNDSIESELQDIFEWWIVSEWFYRKLKARNEPVLEWGNNYYWGRTCTGQAILLDSVIDSIAEEMEILAEQKNSWAKE